MGAGLIFYSQFKKINKMRDRDYLLAIKNWSLEFIKTLVKPNEYKIRRTPC